MMQVIQVTKFCSNPELLVRPVPLTAKMSSGLIVMVKALAPGLKTILSTSIAPDVLILVVPEAPKVAISDGPFGTVRGVQFAVVSHVPSRGVAFQVALPARASRVKEPVRITTITTLFFIELVPLNLINIE